MVSLCWTCTTQHFRLVLDNMDGSSNSLTVYNSVDQGTGAVVDATQQSFYTAASGSASYEQSGEEQGYYDENGEWIWYGEVGPYDNLPEGHVLDDQNRLMKSEEELEAMIDDNIPEDAELLLSGWKKQELAPPLDWKWTSKVVWPDIEHTVILKRLDIYEQDNPHLQQATTNLAQSRRIRNTNGWRPYRTVFFLDSPNQLTTELVIESTGPPKRNKYRPPDKENARDFSTWIHQETLNAYIGADRILGTSDFFSDFRDLPDRYFLNSDPEPEIGSRRLYRFAAYAVTQYFILEKKVFHEQLYAEGKYENSFC
mmetsp:Transcript_20925/g.35452  ORF Transcript_20925/g.35452 Transcript_20925/m.35452 type:complete len:312 (+) Transcript_20925:3-938(+)